MAHVALYAVYPLFTHSCMGLGFVVTSGVVGTQLEVPPWLIFLPEGVGFSVPAYEYDSVGAGREIIK